MQLIASRIMKINNLFFKLFSFALCVSVVAVITGCKKETIYTPVSSNNTVLYDFWLEETQSNTSLNRPYQGMIVGDTVRLTVDYGTDITALEPTVFADADSILPKGKQ